MKLDYCLDMDEKSVWKINTPNSIEKSLPFYINEYGHYNVFSDYYTEREGLDNYLLMYTVSGSGLIKYNNQEFILNPHQCIVVNCKSYHYYRTNSQGSWNFKWIHFNGIAAHEHYNLLNDSSINIVTVTNPVNFESVLDSLAMYVQVSDISSNVKISAQLTSIISSLIVDKFAMVNNKKSSEHRYQIEKVLEYIHEYYNNKITLDDLINIAFLSRYYFLRVFKRYMGTSPYEYIMNYRINKSKELLRENLSSVSEIALQVGFAEANNFIREFKKVVGITPLNYRKYYK